MSFVQSREADGNWVYHPVVNGGLGFYDGTGRLTEILNIASTTGNLQVRFLFCSNEANSDEDGLWNTDGAVIVDSISVVCYSLAGGNTTYFEDFEDEVPFATVTDDGCWTAEQVSADCPCGTIGTEQSTWGRIKALYSE